MTTNLTEEVGESLDRIFARCRELERARCAAMPDVPALKIYDVLMGMVYPSLALDLMAALGCKCDDEGDVPDELKLPEERNDGGAA